MDAIAPSRSQTALRILSKAANPSIEEGIEQMRANAASPEESPLPTVSEVASTVNGISVGMSLDEIAEMVDRDPEFLTSMIQDFSIWLNHSKGKVIFEFVPHGTFEQETLFAVPRVSDGSTVAQIERPEGFPETETMDKALAAIIVHRPSISVINRYMQRLTGGEDLKLGYDVLAGVHAFALAGRIAELIDVGPNSTSFQASAVEAYDTLDLARRDAVNSLSRVIEADSSGNMAELKADIVTARVLFESELNRMYQLVERASQTDSLTGLIQREQRFLALRVIADEEQYAPGNIKNLSARHVLRIAEAVGLPTERDRPTEDQARKLLQGNGLGDDVDKHLMSAVQAIRDNYVPEFLEELLKEVVAV